MQYRPFPTTTIGSFPQTPAIRRARLAFKKERIRCECWACASAGCDCWCVIVERWVDRAFCQHFQSLLRCVHS